MKHLLIILTISFLFAFQFRVNSQVFNYTSDNRSLLEDTRVNPELAKRIKIFLDTAAKVGFKPVVHEAYRSFERSEQLSTTNENIRPAAKISMHNYGLAVDIWLRNKKGVPISWDAKERAKDTINTYSLKTWMSFINLGRSLGLINAVDEDDSDHWEYHPNWNKTKWVSANRYAKPIYDKYNTLEEKERLRMVWKDAGLSAN